MCLVLNCMGLLVCHAWWPCTAGADLWAVWSLIGGAACKSFNTTQILKDRRFVFVELWKKSIVCIGKGCVASCEPTRDWERWPGSWREAGEGFADSPWRLQKVLWDKTKQRPMPNELNTGWHNLLYWLSWGTSGVRWAEAGPQAKACHSFDSDSLFWEPV